MQELLSEIILASASPRRRDLLQMFGIEKLVVIPALGGEIIEPGLSPDETVKRLASAKAREIAALHGTLTPIIAADTIVYIGGEILGKPESERSAADMLEKLSGKTHSVFTGVAVLHNEAEQVEAVETRVVFRRLSECEISAYIKTGEPMDKAGAYGAQGMGGIFIERIDGDFYNVMGLPLCRLGIMLERIGKRLI